MAHEIDRVLRAFSAATWFIDPRKAEQIVAALELRMRAGPRSEPYLPDRKTGVREMHQTAGGGSQKAIHVIRLHGTILPRAGLLEDMSGAVSLQVFQKAFRQAAADQNAAAIVLDVDSPGGQVDLVPETAAMIRAARRSDRPIVAVANTFAASAAYWIASAADELVVTPSGEVGSIGVYMVHEDVSQMLEEVGIKPTFIYEGPRKVEGNPFEPLSEGAKAAMQAGVRHYYEMFTSDVAQARGVPVEVVRADPEGDGRHFGGGRSYPAARAVELGMADRVETIDETISRLMAGVPQSGPRASIARRRLEII